jgi:hypothetical protein
MNAEMFQVQIVRVVYEYDDVTPAFVLGRYSPQRPPKNLLELGLAFDRGAGVTADGGLRYFVSSVADEIAESEGINASEIAAVDYLNKETARSRFERAEAFGDEWVHMAITAEADILWRHGPGYSIRTQTFTSAGARNLESDSDEEDIERVVSDQLNDLRCTLEAFGCCVSDQEWESSVADKQTLERTVPARD